jgi:SAM-dependent methyltransferase
VLRALARLPFLAVRRLRWWRGSWSKDSDRSYHEQLYDSQAHDPFDPGYPGYVTIRRFADHVEGLLPAAGTVLDVGCGPGEITCELARRHPHLAFAGIDHSAQAIRRATAHAARLSLTNVRFTVGDAEDLPPDERYGLVTVFDAFHHLEDPGAFLRWLAARTTRCVLIEPAGTWSGGWARGVDVDWLLADLANIRERLEAACGVTIGSATDAAAAAGAAAEPEPAAPSTPSPVRGHGAVERRYAIDDFVRFFAGWQLRIEGTIAGIDRYPPPARTATPLRALGGELAYALIRATDALLRERDRDGAAKHWVIAATIESGVIEPRLPPSIAPSVDAPPSTIASAYDVRYTRTGGPSAVQAGGEFRVTVEIENRGWDTWRSEGAAPVHVSSHWLTAAGEMAELDGLRTDLPAPLGPGESATIALAVRAPSTPGRYLLAIDLVKEGVTWFSDAGAPWRTIRVDVR